MGYMAIHCAATKGSLPLVTFLIEFGVDVNVKTEVSIVEINALIALY